MARAVGSRQNESGRPMALLSASKSQGVSISWLLKNKTFECLVLPSWAGDLSERVGQEVSFPSHCWRGLHDYLWDRQDRILLLWQVRRACSCAGKPVSEEQEAKLILASAGEKSKLCSPHAALMSSLLLMLFQPSIISDLLNGPWTVHPGVISWYHPMLLHSC